MKSIDIEALNERAARLYSTGQYQEAKCAWEKVLAADPANSQASEGVEMVRTLTGASGLDNPLEQEIVAIEEMLLGDHEADGVRAAEALALAHPDSTEIAWLATNARARFESGPFIEEATRSARRAWKRGDLSAARSACARILAVDPDHCTAREVLMEADRECAPGDGASPIEASIPPVSSMRETPAGPDGLRPAPESASDSLFELDESDVIPLASPEDAAEGDAAGAPHSDSEETFTEASFADAFQAPAPKPQEEKFAELEEEIYETLSDIDSEPAAAAGPAPSAPPQETLSDDLTFGGWSLEETSAEDARAGSGSASGPGRAVDPRIAEFLQEARAAIDAGRFSEAIETASRAFAIDAEAPGAQDVIDLARARLDEVDRQSEEHLYHAHKFLEEGDDTAAEALLREVLRTHPGHREATDLLARISEHKNAAEIQAVPLARPDPPRAAARVPEVEPSVPLRKTDVFEGSERLPGKSESEVEIPPIERTQRTSVRTGPSVYRFVFYAILVLLVIGVAALGLRFLPKFFIGSDGPAPAPISKRPVRKEVIAPRLPVAKPPDQNADPSDPGSSMPRTLDQARTLVSEGKLKEARAVLTDIVNLDPGNRPAVDLLSSVGEKLLAREQNEQALASIRGAFSQDRYEDSLRMLYRLPPNFQSDEVDTFKRNAWYNNGILYMLGGNSVDAQRCFKEALDLDPHDEGAKKQVAYLRSYEGREKDGVYFRHVETLPRRAIDQR